ncbi:ATP-grasp domain-containing protein [Solihabitans fulvus]|uniref:ATP-grasp domain-containing protein n=1 Tax=Solihabitans fulvus TaxID=1892852 RepID=A0A5B2WJ52_9PSEU|nr:ATP-grasp domain-containing protein [Solihabitans fulvus]KAA2250938.1 ATP-grasp domain-containing protein [Solihabitans fulvus]
MSGRVVVIVEPYSSGAMLAPALRQDGLSPVAVTQAKLPPYADTFRPADFDEHLWWDADADRVLARLRALEPVAVIAGAESGTRLGDLLAAELTPGLANTPDLSSARRNKGDMVAAVAAHSLATIGSLCTRDPAEVEPWLDLTGLRGRDLVVKPAESSSTDGVMFVPGGRDWRAAVDALLGAVNCYGQVNEDVIVQEYVTGTEYAVDTFSFEGRHTVNDIARYRKAHNGGHIAVYESMEFLPFDGPGHAELVEYVRRVLDAVGVRFGAAHTEVMLTDRGPLLIETAARLGGGGQPWTCQLATGDNAIDRLVRYLGGDRDIRADYPLEQSVLVAYFMARTSGRVGNLVALDAIRDLESFCHLQVNVRDGDHIAQTADLFDSQGFGTVVLGHEDPGQVRADYAELRRIEREVIIEALAG